jgi:lysine-N-methylase
MTRFRCLGGECEATCCGGWGIAVEASAHRRLKVLAAGNAGLTELVERAIQLTPDGPDYARLKFLPSGGCSMLDPQGLCRIHGSFGHEVLFDVCATYPRYANQVDGELELFGTLSCPEVARLALLESDAFDIISSEEAEPPRKLRNRFETKLPYYRPYRLVRKSMLGLLQRPDYALAEKLFVLLWLSDKLRPVLHVGCPSFSDQQLEKAFAALGETAVLDALGATLRSLGSEGPMPLMILHSAFTPTPSLAAAHDRHFSEIVRRAWSACGLEDAPGGDGEAELLAVWNRYAQLRAGLADAARERVEVCVTRHAMNHLLTTPYMLSSNLFEYVYDLVVRVAGLRFFLVTRLHDFAGSPQELDAAVVDVAFSFARAVEHGDLPQRVQAMLGRLGLDGLAHAACFLAV